MTKFICRWCTGPAAYDYLTVRRECVNTQHLGTKYCPRCRENSNEVFMDWPPTCDSFELAARPGVNILPKEGGAK